MILLLFHHHHHDKQIFSYQRLVCFKYFSAGFSCSGALMFLNIQFWLFRILQRRLHNLQSAFRNYFQAQVCHALHVFYISVCMFFAYLESSIVAMFYFALTSEGSLNNFKLTALRSVAIGLTLKASFSSSMHIILTKPTESLPEGLSEK